MTDFTALRHNMVDGQIRPSSVTDWRIIDAMRAVPREAFVPEAQRGMAYLDSDIEVGGDNRGRCLLKPAVTARLLQGATLQDDDHVLIVGCATGYLAAVAARIVARVTALESDADLAASARDILCQQGIGNVAVETGPLEDGVSGSAPFNAIFLNGATEVTPAKLYRQLAEEGRLLGIFAMHRPPRAEIITRSDDDFGSRILFDTHAPVLPGFERKPAFVF